MPPEDKEEWMITNILVPTDGSDTARKAAVYACELAGLCRARVILLTVVDRSTFVGTPSVPASQTPAHIVEPLEDYLRGSAEANMEKLEKLCERHKIPVNKVIRFGHPVEEIVGEAEGSKADLIVMGSHGKSALKAALLGSVTFGVVHQDTHIPVLIVRK
jgi:nucleotide-binding universal stress UspA family protein